MGVWMIDKQKLKEEHLHKTLHADLDLESMLEELVKLCSMAFVAIDKKCLTYSLIFYKLRYS